jgi:hypothetical protein
MVSEPRGWDEDRIPQAAHVHENHLNPTLKSFLAILLLRRNALID